MLRMLLSLLKAAPVGPADGEGGGSAWGRGGGRALGSIRAAGDDSPHYGGGVGARACCLSLKKEEKDSPRISPAAFQIKAATACFSFVNAAAERSRASPR